MPDPWLVVPTRGDHPDLLDELVAGSGLSPDHVVVVRTADCSVPFGVRRVDDLGPVCIQRWWNRGIDLATGLGARFVAVANDDVTLDDPAGLHAMADLLDQTPAVICWAHPVHMTGWLWMLDTDSDIRPDERYAWWYGDTDLVRQADLVGGNAGLDVPHTHHHPNGTTAGSAVLRALAAADRASFAAKWRP